MPTQGEINEEGGRKEERKSRRGRWTSTSGSLRICSDFRLQVHQAWVHPKPSILWVHKPVHCLRTLVANVTSLTCLGGFGGDTLGEIHIISDDAAFRGLEKAAGGNRNT
eukprot:4502489-Pyramimonas_sp.AAC.2